MLKKKILIIGFGIDKDRTEAVSQNTIKNIDFLKELGFQVYLINIGYSNTFFNTGNGFFDSIINRNKIIKNIDSFIKENKITHVLDVFVLPLSSFIFTLPLSKSNENIIFIKEIHNDFGFSKKIHKESFIRIIANNKLIFSKILNGFDKIITKNLDLSKKYTANYIPTVIDIQKIKNINNKKLNICYLGHPLRKKGIYSLLELFKIIPNKYKNKIIFNIAFSDVGPRKKVELLFINQAKINKIELHLFGKVKPSQFFRKNDIYILPIQDEYGAISTPNTILEAMEANCLVIANNIKSLKGVAFDKKNILLLKNNSECEILRVLKPVLDNYNNYSHIIKRGRKLIIKNHNKKNIIKKIKELYA